MPSSGLTQFDYLYNALADKFPAIRGNPDGTTIFQFAAMPIAADWISGHDEKAYDLANKGSTQLDGFYSGGSGIENAYRDLISAIASPDVEDNEGYKKSQALVEDYSRLLGQEQTEAERAYQDWAALNTTSAGTPAKTITEWLKDPIGGISFGDRIELTMQQLKTQQERSQEILEAVNDPLARVYEALKKNTMKVGDQTVAAVTIDGELARDKTRWDRYKNQYDFEATLEKDSTIDYPWKTLYSAQVHQDCWSTNVSVKVDTSRIIADEHYKLEVTAVGLQAYTISRSAWFDTDYLNPNIKLSTTSMFDNDTFFGLSGSLHLIPQMLVVIYKPSYKLTVSTEIYKQQFQANTSSSIEWIDLFATRFKFSGLASLAKVGEQTTTLTFPAPESASPQVLGVISDVHWNKSKAASNTGEGA
jgi:hypothetical protein